MNGKAPLLALALGAVSAMLAAVFLYAFLRATQLFTPEPNPATVIWSAHAGYFWRVLTSLFAAGMVGMLTFLVARHDPSRVARALPVATLVASVAIAVQALFAP